jgi:hypothetical protein
METKRPRWFKTKRGRHYVINHFRLLFFFFD